MAPPFIARGRVVGSDDLPLRRVRITVQSDQAPQPAFTDEQGRFELIVPASSGGLRFTKAGYLAATIGRREAQAPSGVTVHLTKGAAISGSVIDQSGNPAVGVQVRVRRIAGGPGTPGGQYTTDTDDLGEFRVGSLPAGRYTATAGQEIADDVRELLELVIGGGNRGQGVPPEVRDLVGQLTGRGRGDPAPNAAPGGQAGGGRGGRGRGGRGRGDAPVPPNQPTLDVTAGQEASLVLIYESPAAAALPEIASIVARASTATLQAAATATIRGRIVSQDGTPIRSVSVQMMPAENAGTRRIAMTDAAGRYEVTGVTPGRYRVRASKSGLVRVEYGQNRADQPGRVLDVTAGQRLQGIDVVIPRGSTLNGTLTDEAGEPIEGATIEAWQSRFVDGRTMLSPVSGIRSRRTDDRGRYRLYGLLPGNYHVVAVDNSGGGRGGGGRGGGGRGGRGGGEDGTTGGRVYYPGTSSTESAAVVLAEIGRDTMGVDIAFIPDRVSRIEGRAVRSTGEPARGRALLSVSQRSGALILPARTAGLDSEGAFTFRDVPAGDYVVQVIEGGGGAQGRGGNARGGGPGGGGQGGGAGGQDGGRGRGGGGRAAGAAGPVGAAQPGAPAQVQGPAAGRGGRGQAAAGAQGGNRGGGRGRGQAAAPVAQSEREFGAQFVTVTPGERALVVVETAPGTRMTGQIVLEGDVSGAQPSGFGFAAYPADFDTAPLAGAAPMRAAIRDDGTFEIVDLNGALRFEPVRAPEGWWLKAVTVNGINAVREPAVFGRGSPAVTDVSVVFASGTGAVTGRVLDERRQPATEFEVVVFAADPDLWFSRSPYVKWGSPSQDGTFTVAGLPPGEYLAAAVDRFDAVTDSGSWQNPAVLSSLAGGARRLTIAGGSSVSAELRLLSLAP